jgi:coenzyme PQQ precursor peptide PqqA
MGRISHFWDQAVLPAASPRWPQCVAPHRRSHHDALQFRSSALRCWKAQREDSMAWTTPVLVEICIGLEINGYLPPEL